MTDLLEVRIVNAAEDFESLREDWHKVVLQSASSSVFLTWEWLYTWWIHFGDLRSLSIVLFSEPQGDLVGIAPLYIRAKRSIIGPINILSLLGSETVASDYLDFIIVEGREREVLKSFFEYLDKDRSWELIELKDIPLASVNLPLFEPFVSNKGYSLHQSVKGVCPFIALPKRWEDFIEGLQTKKIKRLEGYIKKLKREVGFEFHKGLIDDSLEKTMGAFLELHLHRMRATNRVTHFSGEHFLRFHLDVAARFLRRGWLTFYRLVVEGKTVSILYCFNYNDCLYFYNSGMDMNWSRYKVGNILFYFAIKDCIEKGLEGFLFLRGDEAYKYFWTKSEHKAALVHITRKDVSRIKVVLDFYLNTVLKRK